MTGALEITGAPVPFTTLTYEVCGDFTAGTLDAFWGVETSKTVPCLAQVFHNSLDVRLEGKLVINILHDNRSSMEAFECIESPRAEGAMTKNQRNRSDPYALR
ncbi:hypothetical protein Tco_0229436 [Tanacetum coccineum]